MSRSPARMSRLAGLVGLAASAAIGCGGVTAATPDGGNGSDAPAETAPVTTEEACGQVAQALCDALNTCAPVFVEEQYGDESTCVSRATLSCMTDQSTSGITRTADDLVACAKAATGISCADALAGNLPMACDLTPGTVTNGTACGSNLQCQSTYCNNAGTCGVCGPRLDAGGACTSTDGCAMGLVCAGTTCVKPGGLGDACDLPAQPCSTNLYCSSAKAPGTCMARLGAGASCANNGDACDYSMGAICNTLANPNVCVTINIAKPGDACGLGSKTLCVGGVAPCSNILGKGVCANPADDGAACGGNALCIPPATCVNKLCVLPSVPNCQ
jgi:hypothetical protein